MKCLFMIPLLFMLNWNAQSFAQQIEKIGDIESCVVAICSDKPDTKNILGSGFIASKYGIVVTADHVIFDEIREKVHRNLFCGWPTYPEPLWFRLSVTRRFKQGVKGRDIALLQIISDGRVGSFPFLEIGDEFEIGDAVLIAGFPHVFGKIYHWPLFRKGIIASTAYKYQDNRVIVLDLPSVDGYSGSPVFNLEKRKVVAIIKGGSAQRKGTGFSVAVVIEKNDLQNRAAIEGPR